MNKPTPNDSCAVRDAAAVSPQAFTLLNSQIVSDRSFALALRLQESSPELPDQIDGAFALSLGRTPLKDERERLIAYAKKMTEYHDAHHPTATRYPPEITRSLVEEFSGKPFEYIEWLPAFKDYKPDTKPDTVDAKTRALADVCLILLNTNEFIYVY